MPLSAVTLPIRSPRTMTDDDVSGMIGTFNRYGFVILDGESSERDDLLALKPFGGALRADPRPGFAVRTPFLGARKA